MSYLGPLNVDMMGEDERALLPHLARRRHALIVMRSRDDPDMFCQHVLRDDRTGKRMLPASPVHREWSRLIAKHDRLVVWAHVDCGKTVRISIARTLWELGRNPNLRVAIISKTKDLARKIVRACQQIISGDTPSSRAFREVFPDCVPSNDPSMPWTSLAFTVKRTSAGKDPSIQASGNFGNIIGSRIDLLILDDMLDSVNTRTPAPRSAIWDWVHGTLLGRLAEDARVVCVGNAWHPQDMMHRFAAKEGYASYRFPVIDAKTHEPTWPEHWPAHRIERAKDEFGPLDYARQLLCQARDDDSSKFRREWIEGCLERGRGLRPISTIEDLLDEIADPALAAAYRLGGGDPGAVRLYTGVDLAVQQHAAADLTALVTVAVLKDGTRRLVWIESGRWAAPEILRRIEDHHRRYRPTFVVENVAAQDYIRQLLQAWTAIPIIPYTTGRQIASPEFGIEQLANELAAQKWILPCPDGKSSGQAGAGRMNPELFALVQDILSYDPRAHKGDRLMGMFFAREGAVQNERRAQGASIGVRIFGAAPPPGAGPPGAGLPGG